MTITGIDVSNYQSTTYSLSGIDFVVVKATQSTNYVNPKHTDQVSRARSNGRVVGHYHFLVRGNVTAQASYFVAHAAPKAGDFLACDWETNPADNTYPSNAEKDAFIKAVKTLRPDLKVLLYTGQSFWLNKDTTSYYGDGLWIAQYNNKPGQPAISSPWMIHQYTSDPLDTNVANFASRSAMAAWAAGNTDVTEEDPLAAMTKQDIFDAVWKSDQIAAPTDAADVKTNPTWQAQSYLKDTNALVRSLQTTVTAQGAAINTLSKTVAQLLSNVSSIDPTTLISEIKAAIESVTVKLDVPDA